MGPKRVNCCRPEPMGTQEYGNMLKRMQVLEDSTVPAKAGKKLEEGQKRRISRKEYQTLLSKFEMDGIMAQQGLWNLVGERSCGKVALPKEEGDVTGEYKAVHEEKFLSSWLREDGEKRETLDMGKDNKEERCKKEEEKGRKERTKRELLKENVSGLFLWRPLKNFIKGGDLESCGGLSRRDLLDELEDVFDRESEVWVDALVALGVTDVPGSPSSVVTEFCDGFSCSDWELVEPQLTLVQSRRKR